VKLKRQTPSVFDLNDAMYAHKTPKQLRELVRKESKKIQDPRIQNIYIVRTLYAIGDPLGRELAPEELTILDKTIRKEVLDSSDKAYLTAHEAEYQAALLG